MVDLIFKGVNFKEIFIIIKVLSIAYRNLYEIFIVILMKLQWKYHHKRISILPFVIKL